MDSLDRQRRNTAYTFVTALLISLTNLQAQTTQPTSRPQVVLVELFTSEGCSSCPPADVLLQQINGTQANPGQLIVGISEHVTYWNSLGWSDPFSSSIYTERQNAYGERFGLESVYTPQMVVNGTHQFVGNNKASLLQALQKEKQASSIDLRILSTKLSEASLSVKFSATGDIPAHGVDIVAVFADDSDRSSVLRGENSGRTLTHVAVARSLTRVAKLQAATEQTVQIPVPPSFHSSPAHHLILFAQTAGNGRVLGTDTKPL
ncbi:DUF1223 domain-containing protein [Granulicella sp. dw_53]|uniref:DUF1223 domain-containing protein n=1 Tax=Granulicella sp. dw_53 TaxID=2719792 RepID=UPI001BD4FE23|nr:DUF1223 domain-containing protein [Granulicella sp. dw_53]